MKTCSCVLAVTVGMVVLVSGCSSPIEVKPQTAPVEIGQTRCPVIGRAIDEEVFVEHGGRRVYFCCTACEGTFKKAPRLFLAKLDKTATD